MGGRFGDSVGKMNYRGGGPATLKAYRAVL